MGWRLAYYGMGASIMGYGPYNFLLRVGGWRPAYYGLVALIPTPPPTPLPRPNP